MPRPVTLFTGQWADLPLAELAPLASDMGYDGLELACWGDHFDVDRGDRAAGLRGRAAARCCERHGLQCHAISTHLVGQAVCDRIDERHKAILPPARLGRRRPGGRAPARRAARSAPRPREAGARVRRRRRQRLHRLEHLALDLRVPADRARTTGRPASATSPSAGRRSWTRSTSTTCDFGLEVHPTEIAFDIASAQRALEAIGGHKQFGFNYDPSHLGYQGVDYVAVHPHASATASSTPT